MKIRLHVLLTVLCSTYLVVRGATSAIGGLVLNVLAACIVVLLEFLVVSPFHLGIVAKTVFRGDRVRLSLSYLIRIRVDDKYLLVLGNRIKNQFQPVGGVYKVLEGGRSHLESLGVRKDEAMASDPDDLRINVPAKRVLDVVTWFDSAKCRECTPIREFDEELLDEGIVLPEDQALFRTPMFSFTRRHVSGIKWSPHLKMRELLMSDIYELVPTNEQLEALRRIKDTDKAAWFTTDEIERFGRAVGGVTTHKISNNAPWILPTPER